DAVVSADPDALVLAGYEESGDILSALYGAGFTADDHHIYLTDGNTHDTLGEHFTGPGTLDGITGLFATADTPTELRGRLHRADYTIGNGDDVLYAPETYDAVMITALATAIAGTDDPAAIARQINGVTRDGEACRDFA